jgi:hypothetical protein
MAGKDKWFDRPEAQDYLNAADLVVGLPSAPS